MKRPLLLHLYGTLEYQARRSRGFARGCVREERCRFLGGKRDPFWGIMACGWPVLFFGGSRLEHEGMRLGIHPKEEIPRRLRHHRIDGCDPFATDSRRDALCSILVFFAAKRLGGGSGAEPVVSHGRRRRSLPPLPAITSPRHRPGCCTEDAAGRRLIVWEERTHTQGV